jgi:hypothetical protein
VNLFKLLQTTVGFSEPNVGKAKFRSRCRMWHRKVTHDTISSFVLARTHTHAHTHTHTHKLSLINGWLGLWYAFKCIYVRTYKKMIHVLKCDGALESQMFWLWDIQNPHSSSTPYEYIKQRNDVGICIGMTSSEWDGKRPLCTTVYSIYLEFDCGNSISPSWFSIGYAN